MDLIDSPFRERPTLLGQPAFHHCLPADRRYCRPTWRTVGHRRRRHRRTRADPVVRSHRNARRITQAPVTERRWSQSALRSRASSSRARQQRLRRFVRRMVDWQIVRRFTPMVMLASYGSGFIASMLPLATLRVLIGGFLGFVSVVMLTNWRPSPHRVLPGRRRFGGRRGTCGSRLRNCGHRRRQRRRADARLLQCAGAPRHRNRERARVSDRHSGVVGIRDAWTRCDELWTKVCSAMCTCPRSLRSSARTIVCCADRRAARAWPAAAAAASRVRRATDSRLDPDAVERAVPVSVRCAYAIASAELQKSLSTAGSCRLVALTGCQWRGRYSRYSGARNRPSIRHTTPRSFSRRISRPAA